MTTRHPAITFLVTAIALLVLAAPAAAESESGVPLPADPSPPRALAKLLAATTPAKVRSGLGQPPYRAIFGSDWKRTVRRADRKLVAKLRSSLSPARPASGSAAETSARQIADADPLGAADALRGRNGRQTRRFRAQAAVDPCPVLDAEALSPGSFWVRGRVRGEYVVTTVERLRRFDIRTTVIFGLTATSHSQTTRAGSLAGITAERSQLSVTRSQTATDRRTGESRPTGLAQRYLDELSPLWVREGGFEEFVANHEGDGPVAPRRVLRSGAWARAADGFIEMVFVEQARAYAATETRSTTPGGCLSLTLSGPSTLALGKSALITGHPAQVSGGATVEQILIGGFGARGEYINPRGQTAEIHGDFKQDWPAGEPWYRFTAPGERWPAANPIGLKLRLTTGAGVAEASITFAPAEESLFFKVLDVSGSVDTSDVRTASGQCTFTAGDHRIDVGPRTGAGAGPEGHLSPTIGSLWTPITHVTQPYSTLLACPSGDTRCEFPLASLPGQNLGVSMRRSEGGDVRLEWSFIAVEVGDSRCSLQVPDLYVDRTLLVSTYPAERFEDPEPFKIENSGSHPYSIEQGIATISGKLDWEFEITLQRVGRDGEPL